MAKQKKAAGKAGMSERRRGKHRRTTTERRNKSRWDPKVEDRRKGFGRRDEDRLWERLVDND